MILKYSLPRHFIAGCTSPFLPLAIKSNGLTTPYEAICKKLEITNCSARTFKVQVFRAKNKFKKTLLNILESALHGNVLSSIEQDMIRKIISGIKKNL